MGAKKQGEKTGLFIDLWRYYFLTGHLFTNFKENVNQNDVLWIYTSSSLPQNRRDRERQKWDGKRNALVNLSSNLSHKIYFTHERGSSLMSNILLISRYSYAARGKGSINYLSVLFESDMRLDRFRCAIVWFTGRIFY